MKPPRRRYEPVAGKPPFIRGSKPRKLSGWEKLKISLVGVCSEAVAVLFLYSTPENAAAVGSHAGKLPAVVAAVLSVAYAISLFVRDTRK